MDTQFSQHYFLKMLFPYSVEFWHPCHLSGACIHSYFVPSIYMSVWCWLCAVSISLDL